jgi:hypothetical protein
MAKRLFDVGSVMFLLGVLLILASWFDGSSPINPYIILWPGLILAVIGYHLGGRRNF